MSARLMRGLEGVLWCLAVAGLGCFAAAFVDRTLYQSYQDWSFDQKLRRQPAPLLGYALHSLRVGPAASPWRPSRSGGSYIRFRAPLPEGSRMKPGTLIGRIEIPAIGVRSMIVEGTDPDYLVRAVGHIEGSALPGGGGNVGLAGHRDTFFRELRRIAKHDLIQVTTLDGAYEYAVDSVRIVGPDDVSVLRPEKDPVITLVTCYPFNYVGAAPRRFIVQAHETSAGSDGHRLEALEFRR